MVFGLAFAITLIQVGCHGTGLGCGSLQDSGRKSHAVWMGSMTHGVKNSKNVSSFSDL